MADKKEYKELEREALLSILLETEKLAEVGGWEWDIKKDVWTFSDNWLLIHGCTTRHLSTSDLLPIAHPDDRADIQRAFDKALVEGAKYEIEHRIIRQDTGEERYVRALGRPKLDEDGKPVKLFGSAQDITESKKVDKTLRESEEKFRHLFDNSPTGKTITYVSGELQSNAAFAQMLGYSQDEFQNFAWQDITHPDDMDLSQNTIESLLSGRKESDRFTKRYIHKNGSIVWADVSTRVQRDSKGNPLYFITAVIDITEMKKAEKALQEANERFKLTESIANVGSWQWDIQTDHVQWSEELFRIFGRDPSSGAPSYADHGEIYVDEDMQRLDGAVKACVSMGKQYELVLQAIRADGEIRHCVARGQAQKNDDGKVVRIVGSFQDITERKQAEAALRESEQEFKNITENIPGLVLKYKLHPDGTDELIYLSKGVKDLYEVSREDALNNVQLLWERIHKDDLDDYVLSIQKSSETMTLWEKEHRISLPDGKIKWIQARGTPNKQSDGSIIWNTIGIDITDHKRAEEERRKSDERFRVAQEMSPDGFTIFRPVRNDQNQIIDFTWVYENEAVAKMNGTDPQEVVGQRLLELFPGHKGTQFFNSYKEVAETGKPITFEEGYVGETIKKKTWFRIVVVPMAENIAILNQDITERKLIEENLANTFNLSPSIISKANVDTGYFTEVSPVVTKILGFSIEEFTSRPFMEFVHPDDRQRTIKEVSEQLQGKEVASFENRYLCKDGSYKWIAWQGTPADKNGIVTAIGSDINERKQAEQKLLESEVKYRHLYETMTQGVAIQDADGHIIEANSAACEILGLNLDQMLGKTVFDPRWRFIHEDGSPYDPNEMPSITALRTGKPVEGHHCGIYIPEKDEYRWIVIGSVPRFKEGETKPFVTMTVFTDITELKGLQSKLQQAQKMESIGTLAGGIAHDFNNILSSVIGFTELALDSVDKETSIADDLHEVYSAGLRAKDLVQQILTFARQSDEKLSPIQVDLIIKEVLKFIRSSIPTTIEIKQNIESDSLIMGNSTQVHRIMMNLCTNAAHAMENEGGTLEIALKDITIDRAVRRGTSRLQRGNYIEIKVSDTGDGIDPQVIDKIFDPYFTTKKQGEGTGMGLAMVHGIVETYGGEIFVESRLRKGTVFTIYLPVARARKTHQQYKLEELPKGQERILFVDDEVQITKMACRILGQLGYSVTTRTSSLEALELFRSKPNDFDLIISDVTMPKMTGDQLTKKLIDIRPDIPVILCTGFSKNLSEERASEIGIMAFAYKPIVKEDLAKTVRDVLDLAKV